MKIRLILFTLFFYGVIFNAKEINAFFLDLEQYEGRYTFTYPKIGIVDNYHDQIDQYFNRFMIPFERIAYRELEFKETYEKFDIIYIPNGIEREIDSSLEILARARRVEGVAHKDDYYRINDQLIADHLNEFVKHGGTALFLGYSAKYAQKAFEMFELHHGIGNIGLPGNVTIKPNGEILKYFSQTFYAYMNYEGYYVAANLNDDFANSKLYAYSEVPTPFGIKPAVFSARIDYGKGKVYYIANTGNSFIENFYRFHIIPLLSVVYKDKAARFTKAWEQEFIDYVFDKNLKIDHFRSYYLDVSQGYNSIYAFFESGLFRIDIFNESNELIYSQTGISDVFSKELLINRDRHLRINLYSENEPDGGVFTIFTASGKKRFPYFRKVVASIGILFFIVILRIASRVKIQTRHEGVYSRTVKELNE